MKKFLCLCLILWSTNVLANNVTLMSIDAGAMFVGFTEYAEASAGNIMRVYSSPLHGSYIDGVIKFDLSSIPDDSFITSMTLTTYEYLKWGFPYKDPQVKVYRTDSDSWVSNAGPLSYYPALKEPLSVTQGDFPYEKSYLWHSYDIDKVPVTWSLNVNAVDWSTDLQDDTLSFVLHKENPSVYGFVYFYAGDLSEAPPILSIEYSSEIQPMVSQETIVPEFSFVSDDAPQMIRVVPVPEPDTIYFTLFAIFWMLMGYKYCVLKLTNALKVS